MSPEIYITANIHFSLGEETTAAGNEEIVLLLEKEPVSGEAQTYVGDAQRECLYSR